MDVERFIEESNAIEGVYGDEALRQSLEAWRYLEERDELNHEVVKETHRLIMEKRQPVVAGRYRDCRVRISGEFPPAPSEVPGLMDDLLDWVPSDGEEAVEWHIRFEKIHPFADGNGRTGRMLYWWQCLELGEEPVLWTAENREKYYDLFD